MWKRGLSGFKRSGMRKLSFWHSVDECDATTTTERALITQEDDEDVRGTDGMPTRKSARSRKLVKDNNFVFL